VFAPNPFDLQLFGAGAATNPFSGASAKSGPIATGRVTKMIDLFGMFKAGQCLAASVSLVKREEWVLNCSLPLRRLDHAVRVRVAQARDSSLKSFNL
jgi:hypothetical protein